MRSESYVILPYAAPPVDGLDSDDDPREGFIIISGRMPDDAYQENLYEIDAGEIVRVLKATLPIPTLQAVVRKLLE
jgi:hypothetical protein